MKHTTKNLRRLSGAVTALAFVALLSSPAAAGGKHKQRQRPNQCNTNQNGRPALGAPEIDPSLATGGAVLLLGGTVILLSRKRPALEI